MADFTAPTSMAVGDVFTSTRWNEQVRDNLAFPRQKTTSKQVVNTITETDLLNGEFTISANEAGSYRCFYGEAWGTLKNATGAGVVTPRFKLKLDSTVLVNSGTATNNMGHSVNRTHWFLEWRIQELAATNAQAVRLCGELAKDGDSAALFGTGTGFYADEGENAWYLIRGSNTTAVDMTVSRTLALTVTLGSAHANHDITLEAATMIRL